MKLDILIFVFITQHIAINQCQMCADPDAFKTDILQNTKYIGTPFQDVLNVGLVECMETCLQFKLCKAINFNKVIKRCELLLNIIPDTSNDLQANSQFIFSWVTKWPDDRLAGVCFNHSCPETSRCIPTSGGRYKCEVQGCVGQPSITGINPVKFQTKQLWTVNEIISSPCLDLQESTEDAVCTANGTWSQFQCKTADSPLDCADAVKLGVDINNITLLVDVDGVQGSLPIFEVTCQYYNGGVETVIDHQLVSRQNMKGGISPYSVRFNVTYSVSMNQIITLITRSQSCRQYILIECKHSLISNYYAWLTRDGSRAYYFVGNITTNHVCGCNLNNTCNNDLACNCDTNDVTWRSDEGYITNKNQLPITGIEGGDTDLIFEDSYVTVGPVLCFNI